MYPLATLFNFEDQPVFALMWQKLQKKCGLVTANESSFVHLSWQGAQKYQLDPVHDRLGKITMNAQAIPIKTAGIGIFTGSKPFLYLTVVKNPAVLRLHAILWDQLQLFSQEMNAYYAPQEWVPHITLSYGALLPADVSCAVAELMYEPLSVELRIDNLALIYTKDGSIGIDSRFDFSG